VASVGRFPRIYLPHTQVNRARRRGEAAKLIVRCGPQGTAFSTTLKLVHYYAGRTPLTLTLEEDVILLRSGFTVGVDPNKVGGVEQEIGTRPLRDNVKSCDAGECCRSSILGSEFLGTSPISV
jgi:hypothetical protein